MGLAKKLRSWFKSSKTGRFVSKLFASANPDTTYEQKDR